MSATLLRKLVRNFPEKRAWDETHSADAEFLLQPVLPIVLYTGERRWEKIDALVDLIDAGELFGSMIPAFRPHLLNLRATPPETLVSEGGFFGRILWLIRERHTDRAQFLRTMAHVVADLEQMPANERTRWLEFLSYIMARELESWLDNFADAKVLADVGIMAD